MAAIAAVCVLNEFYAINKIFSKWKYLSWSLILCYLPAFGSSSHHHHHLHWVSWWYVCVCVCALLFLLTFWFFSGIQGNHPMVNRKFNCINLNSTFCMPACVCMWYHWVRNRSFMGNFSKKHKKAYCNHCLFAFAESTQVSANGQGKKMYISLYYIFCYCFHICVWVGVGALYIYVYFKFYAM